MRGKKRFWLILILILALFGGIFYNRRYFYYYNKYNVYAKRAIMDLLAYRYNETFHLISADYMVCENVSGKTNTYIYGDIRLRMIMEEYFMHICGGMVSA